MFSGDDLEKKLRELGLTPFAVEVLMETSRIPRGQTRSYSDLARAIGRPGAARAVGSVLGKNPCPGEAVPCHRVIHKDGRVEGFMGSLDPEGAENRKKKELLLREGALRVSST